MSDIPAVLIGNSTTALGALRSLARRRIPTLVACPADDLVTWSRYFRPAQTTSRVVWTGQLGEAGERLLEALAQQPAMLFPCSDESAMWLAELPDRFRGRFLTSLPSPRALRMLQDKRQFAAVCGQLGVPHPRCFLADAENELDAVPFHELDRAFVKPWNSKDFIDLFGEKGLWVSSAAEARRYWRQAADANIPVFVQEYISGPADRHYFIDGFRDRDGVVRAHMARRRYRMHPPGFGNSSYCRHVPVHEAAPAWESLQKILDHVQYRGIFSAEFKQDAKDGLFKIIEVNTRAWVYIEFATWCGMNVAEMAYRDACGLPVSEGKPTRMQAGCANLYFDARAWRDLGSRRWAAGARFLTQWAAAHKPVFSFRDPGPAVRWLMRRVAMRTGKSGSDGARGTHRSVASQPAGPTEVDEPTSRRQLAAALSAGGAAPRSECAEDREGMFHGDE